MVTTPRRLHHLESLEALAAVQRAVRKLVQRNIAKLRIAGRLHVVAQFGQAKVEPLGLAVLLFFAVLVACLLWQGSNSS